MAKVDRRKGKEAKKPAGQGIKDVDLAGDAAVIIGTAIGVVGGAVSFVGSKRSPIAAARARSTRAFGL